MNQGTPFLLLILLVLFVSANPVTSQDFSEEDLAATISLDSGYPEEGYLEYARSLARTLSMLNPVQVDKVLKGRGPLRKAEVEAARQARKDSPANGGADGKGKANGKEERGD